jgi:hypothetical protein
VQEILDYQSSASADVPEALPWPCPFSISQPPPTDIPDEQLLAVSPPLNNYHRLRGNSISAMSTDGSANPQLNWGNIKGHALEFSVKVASRVVVGMWLC